MLKDTLRFVPALSIAAVAASSLLLGGCASTEGTEKTFDVPLPSYYKQAAAANNSTADSLRIQKSDSSSTNSSGSKMSKNSASTGANAAPSNPIDSNMMRHSLRQIVEYDNYKMSRLVDREIDLKTADNDVFLGQVAVTLGQTVMLQPHFTERETALRELKGKIDQDDYVLVIERAANDLLMIIRSSQTPSDQAGATVALTNLVTEIKSLKRSELREVLQKIADANISVSDQARHYAQDPMEKIVSPSDEAQSALKTL